MKVINSARMLIVIGVMLGLALSIGSASAGPEQENGDIAAIRHYEAADGTQRATVRLATVNADNPRAEAVIGSGPDAMTLVAEFRPRPLDRGERESALVSQVDDCWLYWHRAYNTTELTTTWYYSLGSHVSYISQWVDHYSYPPYHWRNTQQWYHGIGYQYAYSDVANDLYTGIKGLSVQVSNDHAWHQVDAWGNCTAFCDLDWLG